jgi:uncharacterized repeat protein (TIGR03803 family)
MIKNHSYVVILFSAALFVLAMPPLKARAATETFVHSFAGNGTDGALPFWAGLMRDSGGNIWGTTVRGGTSGVGTVFEITASGNYHVVYNFAGGTADGANPHAGLVQDTMGNVWGTTLNGGKASAGVVYEITASGDYKIVHQFAKRGPRGGYPWANLIQDAKGIFWGTTSEGGIGNGGTVFEMNGTCQR